LILKKRRVKNRNRSLRGILKNLREYAIKTIAPHGMRISNSAFSHVIMAFTQLIVKHASAAMESR
jgi:hypothetical protein